MDDYRKRKQERREAYQRLVYGWKQRKCTACNGSGRYDHNGSPRCGGCNGTGKERYKPAEVQVEPTRTPDRRTAAPEVVDWDDACAEKGIHQQ